MFFERVEVVWTLVVQRPKHAYSVVLRRTTITPTLYNVVLQERFLVLALECIEAMTTYSYDPVVFVRVARVEFAVEMRRDVRVVARHRVECYVLRFVLDGISIL